jgi:aldose 1-epimerase
MTYSIKKNSSDKTGYVRLESPETGEYAVVLPNYGGTVYQIALQPTSQSRRPTHNGTSKQNNREDQYSGPIELLECDAPEEIDKNPWFRGRILFPFDDRVHAGRYTFRGTSYQLPINDPQGIDALHGFLYNQSLEITLEKTNPESAMLRLEGDIDRKPGYPFRLHITLDYRLDSYGFHINMHIENRGEAPAPFSVGWHPYFHPLHPGDVTPSADDMRLKLPVERYVETDELLVPSGRLLPVQGTELDFRQGKPVGSLALDHGFINPEGYVEYQHGALTLRIEQSELFAYSQVFIPPDRGSVALEPISAATNAFNQPELGLRVLEPGQNTEGHIRVYLYETSYA